MFDLLYFWHPTHARTTRYEEDFLPQGKQRPRSLRSLGLASLNRFTDMPWSTCKSVLRSAKINKNAVFLWRRLVFKKFRNRKRRKNYVMSRARRSLAALENDDGIFSRAMLMLRYTARKNGDFHEQIDCNGVVVVLQRTGGKGCLYCCRNRPGLTPTRHRVMGRTGALFLRLVIP